MDQEDSKSNLGPLMIGFLLIAAVVAIFFIKSSFFKKIPASDTAEIQKAPEKNYPSISQAELAKQKSKDKYTVIDLRPMANYDREHLIDSLNIPADIFSETMARLEKKREYILVDEMGLTRAEKEIMDLMEENGFEKYSYLEGGFSQWKSQMNPTIGVGDPYSFTDQAKVTYIQSDGLKNALANENNLYIIDLRKENEFRQGHLTGAVNIELEMLEKRREEIPFGKKIILYDQDGTGAFQGAVRLFDMGIFNVYALSDGYKTWQEKGFESVK